MNSNGGAGGNFNSYGGGASAGGGYNGWYNNQSPWNNDGSDGYDRSNQNWATDSFGTGYQQAYSGGPARNNFAPRYQQQQQYGGNSKFHQILDKSS